MKYFTREWLELKELSQIDLDFTISRKARKLDEDFFNELYKEKETEFLFEQEQINEKSVFDENKYKKIFKSKIDLNNKEVISYLAKFPEHIINRVPDLKVFLLGVTTKSILKDITIFCKENIRKADNIIESYQLLLEQESKFEHEDKQLTFYDFTINDFIHKDNNININMGITDYEVSLVFEDCKIILQENKNIKDLLWIHDEVYLIEDGYEIHIMFSDRSYLTFTCKDFTIN